MTWIRKKKKVKELRIESLRKQYAKTDDPQETNGILKNIAEIKDSIGPELVAPRLWVQDVTPEHLGALMPKHSDAMSILSSEGGIFDIMAGRYSKGVPNLDLFLQGHAGDPVRVDRGNRESVVMDQPALTMGLSPQPDVLQQIADQPGFRGRGLLARPLYFLPVSPLGHRTLKTVPVPDQYNTCLSQFNQSTYRNQNPA